ncbi:hypothetical protein M8542_40890 [Amycolatopsis sp. OK19-0408]|uniref:Uncharacterized protein n=1 Tax=Amycolatopsis iheyensis TaxID=2945988 RepID=A0A9X2NKS4_9PSEU|nr:hypothetical protein [Amycolatopsis iheyensis]MCR6489198.1 hypothetical protein [Amycolatopsis iheyensis]
MQRSLDGLPDFRGRGLQERVTELFRRHRKTSTGQLADNNPGRNRCHGQSEEREHG